MPYPVRIPALYLIITGQKLLLFLPKAYTSNDLTLQSCPPPSTLKATHILKDRLTKVKERFAVFSLCEGHLQTE